MSLTHLFQDFGTLKSTKAGMLSMTAEEIEDLKLQSFEGGFQAGWEDAVKAQAETHSHVSAALAASLHSASFEYHELRATLNASVQNIMVHVVDTILPMAARASLGGHIRDFVTSASQDALDCPIEIVVAPECEEVVRRVLSTDLQDPFELVGDPGMSESQATIRLGSQESEINLDKTVAEIALAVATFFETQKSEVTDGRSA